MFNMANWSTLNWEVASTISGLILSIVAIVISVIAVVKTSIDNNKILEESSRAYVSIYTEALITNRNYFYIVFRNFGNSNANIQSLEIDEKTRRMIKIRGIDRFDYLNGSNLAPGQSITHIIVTDNKDYDHNHISKFIITYTSGRKEYSDMFAFNLSAHTRMPSVGVSDGDRSKQFLELYQDEIRKKLLNNLISVTRYSSNVGRCTLKIKDL